MLCELTETDTKIKGKSLRKKSFKGTTLWVKVECTSCVCPLNLLVTCFEWLICSVDIYNINVIIYLNMLYLPPAGDDTLKPALVAH